MRAADGYVGTPRMVSVSTSLDTFLEENKMQGRDKTEQVPIPFGFPVTIHSELGDCDFGDPLVDRCKVSYVQNPLFRMLPIEIRSHAARHVKMSAHTRRVAQRRWSPR